MGGPERNVRQRKRAARAVTKARGGDRRKVVAGIAVVAVLAVTIIGGVLWSRSSGSDLVASPEPATTAPAVRDGAIVVVGKDTAQKTIDVYEDFLCPHCGIFEREHGEEIRKALDSGVLKVRYHVLPMLNSRSTPPGYSQASANATLCAADAGKFALYHQSLFANQPEEGGPGHDTARLLRLGKDIGISGSTFEPCVQNGTHNRLLTDELARARQDPSLQAGGQFTGTPAVVADGKLVDRESKTWLPDLLGN